MRRVRVVAMAVLFSAGTLLGCSFSTSPDSDAGPASTVEPATDLAFTDDDSRPLIDEIPETQLEGSDAALTRFEAEWLCELQRRTFTTPDAIETTLNENLSAAGLARSDYDSFRHRVNVEQDLRDAVLFAYQEICQP